MSLAFVSIADDDTGASDIAGMLAAAGMRTIMILDSASQSELREWARDVDALVLGIASRALLPQDAYAKTCEAIEAVLPLRPSAFGIKYCSTFDSTPQGNIGPSIDAAMDRLGIDFTVAVPALPVNGRTTYMGYHFVGTQLLSDSPMRFHPLNPMTNANLVSHLQSQTRRRVGLVAHSVVSAGTHAIASEIQALRREGVEIAIVDCISDADLDVIAAATAEMQLTTGGSGLALKLPKEWKRLGIWSDEGATPTAMYRPHGWNGTLIVCGSCSQATREQIAEYEGGGGCSVAVSGLELAQGAFDRAQIINSAVERLSRGESFLIRATNDEISVQAVHEWSCSIGSDPASAGMQIAQALAVITAEILKRWHLQGLVIAGGETSSTLCRALGLKALAIGPNIVPGVPLCASMTEPRIPLVLKSGNFGGSDFFQRAISVIEALPSHSQAGRNP